VPEESFSVAGKDSTGGRAGLCDGIFWAANGCGVVEVIDQRIRDNRRLCVGENCHAVSVIKRAKPCKNGVMFKSELF
jgi:hypothetical protein